MALVIVLHLDDKQFGAIMAALDDLKSAVARLNTSVTAEIKAIADKLATFGDDVTSADVEAQVTALNAVADTLDAETKTLTGS